MQAELSIIKAFLNYETWNKYNSYIEAKNFPEELQLLYRTLNSFHRVENESKSNLHILDLSNLFFSTSPKEKEYYQVLFDNLKNYDPVPETIKTLLVSIKRNNLLRSLSLKSYEVAEGKAEYSTIEALLDALQSEEEDQDAEDEFVSDDLESLIHDIYTTPGLRWRLPSLNKNLGSLRKGDFGFIFARPETGKTTFLASEVSYMAEQTNSPVIWFNNEEGGKKVKVRVYQAGLGLTLEQLHVDIKANMETFLSQTNHTFKLKDKVGIHKNEIESICRKYQPSLIIFDQIDKIAGFDADREDLRLGAIYIWARELAKNYAPVIGVCQSDGSGEGVRWLTMSNVANAKTSKQAEADWILGIGAIHDTGWEKVRFFHLSKNKLTGDPDSDPSKRHAKWEVLIKPEIAHYADI